MRYLVVAVALGLATPALAAEQAVNEETERNEPVQMTEVELDTVVAGNHSLLDVTVVVNDVNVGVAAPIQVNAAVLSTNTRQGGSQRAVLFQD